MTAAQSPARGSRKRDRIDSALDRADAFIARGGRWIALLLVLVFVLKLIYVIQSARSLEMRVPILDAKYYDDMGRDIASGRLAQREAFFMGPLYPYFIGLVYAVFGRGATLLRVIQILGGTATVALTYLIGKKMFRPSVAVLGAAMLALYGAATFYEGQLLMEWLGTLLNVLLLFILLRDFGRRPVLKYVAAGFVLGFSALARANILIFAPVILIWIAFIAKEERRFAAASLFLLSVLVAISPATIHNLVVSRDFVFITSNGGMNFHIGNNERATGAYDPPRGVDLVSDMTTRHYVEKMMGREMKPSEVSSYWMREAWRFIREHPAKELSLLARKAALFVNAFELPQIESYDYAKGRYPILRALFVNFWALSSFGLLGFVFALREWRRRFLLHWFIVSYSISIIAFFVAARYRVQIVPPLALFAAFAMAEVLPRSIANLRRGLLALAVFGALVFLTRPSLFAFDMNYIRWREYIHEGRRWGVLGETEKALAEINKALALRPNDAETYIHRAIVYKDSGLLPEAAEDYYRSLRIDPAEPAVHYDLAQVLRRERLYPAAAEEYLRAIAQDSLMIEAYNNLGITYESMKDYEAAIRTFRRAVKLDPSHVKGYNNLGAALAESGDVDGAIRSFKEAIARDPGYANSYKNLAMAYAAQNRLVDAKTNLEEYMKRAPGDSAAAAALRKIASTIEANRALTPYRSQ